jgi:hypothetical protein
VGGYYQQLKMFIRNLFILDEYRSTMVPLELLKRGRADHSLLYFKGNIFALGGMSASLQNPEIVESISSCEVYSVERDQWIDIPSFHHAR